MLSVSLMKPEMQWEGEQRYLGQAMTGYAIPGTELRVVDANDRDVPPDGKTVGEIIARADSVMEGYWRQPDASAEVLRGGWFHTGDMATLNEDGYLLVVDRKKDIIVSGGENISSLELEKAILAHPAVLEAAVIPVPDQKWGEVPKALVVLKPMPAPPSPNSSNSAVRASRTINVRAHSNSSTPCPRPAPGKFSRRIFAENIGKVRTASAPNPWTGNEKDRRNSEATRSAAWIR